jgi:hypothetical protein
MLQDPFPYDLTPAEKEEQRLWEKVQLEKKAKQGKKDNFTINAVNLFSGKNDKIKLKEANPILDHVRLYKVWICKQQKNGRVFKYRSHGPLPWDIRPKINWNKTNVDSVIRLHKK